MKHNKTKDIFINFINPSTASLFILVVTVALVLLAVMSIFQIWNPFAPSGYVVGEFVSAEHRGFGEFCGQYPSTSIVLKNYSASGDYEVFGNEFYFGNQYSDVDNLEVGQKIKISYHQKSRPSDTTSGNTIYYWVIDNIENLEDR